MAMSPSEEAELIVQKLEAIFPRISEPEFRPQVLNYWTKVCEGEIQHKIEAMDVLPDTHGAEDLSSPTGQSVLIPDTNTPHSPSTGATSADKKLVGTGSVQ